MIEGGGGGGGRGQGGEWDDRAGSPSLLASQSAGDGIV
jgi:hypothetical protein